MALYVPIQITVLRPGEGVVLETIDEVEIKRLELLDDPNNPDDEVHNYRIKSLHKKKEARFQHRYGDGVYQCIAKAMEAFGALE